MPYSPKLSVKRWILFALSLLLRTTDLHGQQQPPGGEPRREEGKVSESPSIRILERGLNHRVEQWSQNVLGDDGRDQEVTQTYTVLATGMHYLDSGELKETLAEFVPVRGGFVAHRGPHKVAVSESLNVAGAVVVQSSDGALWKSTPLAFAVRDRDGNVAILGELKGAKAEQISSNTILFRDAFRGDVIADVRVVYSAAGVECDVILRQKLPLLDEVDLNSSELVVLTEVFERSNFKYSPVELPFVTNESEEMRNDAVLELGSLRMDTGRTYSEGIGGSERIIDAPVFRRFYEESGREFLEEATPISKLLPALNSLPGAQTSKSKTRYQSKNGIATKGNGMLARAIQLPPLSQMPGASLLAALKNGFHQSGSIAKSSLLGAYSFDPKPGVVLDWSYVNSIPNQVFRADTTYFVTNGVLLSGNVVFEGGTVVKYSPGGNGELSIQAGASIDWRGGIYRPVMLTARDDNSVGEVVAGSTGSPNGYYAGVAITINGLGKTSQTKLSGLHIRNASTAVNAYYFSGAYPIALEHFQAMNCLNVMKLQYGTGYFPFRVQNGLIVNAGVVFKDLYNASVLAWFLTIDGAPSFRQSQYNPDQSSIELSGSILNNTGSLGTTLVQYNWITNAPSSSVFESSGFGSHYIPRLSPIRLFMDTVLEISPPDNSNVTTLAPQILPTVVSNNTKVAPATELSEIELNYSSVPGYHYAKIHYLAIGDSTTSAVSVTNATLSLLGTSEPLILAIGGAKGIRAQNGGVIRIDRDISTALHKRLQNPFSTKPLENPTNIVVRCSAVQEMYTGSASSLGGYMFQLDDGSELDIRWSRISSLTAPPGARTFITLSGNNSGKAFLIDSHFEFISMSIAPTQPAPYLLFPTLRITNCVFESPKLLVTTSFGGGFNVNATAFTLKNCLLRGGLVNLWADAGQDSNWRVYDNLFDNVPQLLGNGGINGFNAFTATTGYSGANNLYSIIPNWQTGPFGPYYYPTTGPSSGLNSLRDQGSEPSSAVAGLFHYTTAAAVNTKEAGSPIDIGFHYPSASMNGLLLDSDSDGLPDHFEDSNGNGVVEPGESGPLFGDSDYIPNTDNSINDLQELVFGSNPLVYDTDNDGTLDVDEYWAGTNPRSPGDIPNVRLDFLDFNKATLNSDSGFSPILFSGSLVQSFDGLAICFTNVAARIVYPCSVVGNSKPMISFINGTIRFFYSGVWTATNSTFAPGKWCRLLECGEWKLSINPLGTHMVFQSPAISGGGYTNLVVPIPLDTDGRSSRNLEVTLSFSPSFSELTLTSGEVGLKTHAIGFGVEVDVPSVIKANGWTIGNSLSGGYPASGIIDNLETFSCLADPNRPEISNARFARMYEPKRRRANSISATTAPNGIRIQWVRGWEGEFQTNSQLYGISRRVAGSSGAFSSIASGVLTNSWIDTAAVSGTYYEYRVDRHPSVPIKNCPIIIAARDGAPIDQRGRAILIIDQTLTNSLWNDFRAYSRQLAADGWSVTNYYVPRHFDRGSTDFSCVTYSSDSNSGWPANVFNMNMVKDLIRREYTNNPNATNVVLLLGHVPIPYSGFLQEDGHPDHVGAWVADSWYGDMNGQWTDNGSWVNLLQCINSNLPGDGKFDQQTIPVEPDGSPGRLEVPIGRIDFANLQPFLTSGALPGVTNLRGVEEALIRRYFDKILRFRRNEIAFVNQSRSWHGDGNFHPMIDALMGINTGSFGYEVFEKGGQGNDLFLQNTNFLWGVHGDYGRFDAVGYNQKPLQIRQHFSIEIAPGDEVPRGMFMLMWGSYFGDWFHEDSDLLRTCLGMKDSVLDVCATPSRLRTSRFHGGAGFYSALQDTFAFDESSSTRRSILGDPFVRERYISPILNLASSRTGGVINLSWGLNSDADAGYRIYSAPSTNSSIWTLVGVVGQGVTNWSHAPSGPVNVAYLLKGVGMREFGAGKLSVMSIGVATTSEYYIP